jgi:hypothetical protein
MVRVLKENAKDPETQALSGMPVISSLRLATVAPWGEKIFFVVNRPLTKQQLRALPRGLRTQAHIVKRWTLRSPAYVQALPAQITSGHDLATNKGNQLIIVIPDGVATVKIWPTLATGRESPHPLTTTVHDNVALFEAGFSLEPGKMIWYAADGRVIKRIVSP